MRTFTSSLVFMTAVTVFVPAAFAQPEPRAAVSASVGVGSGSSDTGVAVGGALLFDVHERLSVEGQGIYLGRGKGADAFTAGGAVLINLLPASESRAIRRVVVNFDLTTTHDRVRALEEEWKRK